ITYGTCSRGECFPKCAPIGFCAWPISPDEVRAKQIGAIGIVTSRRHGSVVTQAHVGPLTENSSAVPIPFGIGWGKREELAMKTTVLAYIIGLGGLAMIIFGLWSLYLLITERVAELRIRDYASPIQTIAVGLGLIGLARALQLLLFIFVR